MSTKSEGREAGTHDGRIVGRAAAKPIKVDPDRLADYAVKIAGIGGQFERLRTLLLEPGLSSVISSENDSLWASMGAQSALTATNDAFAGVARRTVALGYLFAQVDAATFGNGMPTHAWESFIAGESKKHGLHRLLDSTNEMLEHQVHGVSFRNAQSVHDLLNLPGATRELAGAITVEGVNSRIRKALGGETGKAARARARQALVDALGKDVIGPRNGNRAAAVVNEFIEHGRYEDLDELLGRLNTRGSLPLAQVDRLRSGLLGASGRMARQAEAVRAALAKPGAKASAAILARLAALQASDGRIGELTSKALGARRAVASRLTVLDVVVTDSISGRGALGRAVAKAGLRAGAEATVAIVLLPFDVYTVFTAHSKLGKAAGAFGAVAGTATVLAVATSWTGVGGVGFGTIALVATGASVATTGADAVNQRHQQKVFEKAYGKAFQSSATRAYDEELRKQLQAELDAAQARFRARTATPTSLVNRPAAAPRARASVSNVFRPAFMATAA
jgi:hypothetical protein